MGSSRGGREIGLRGARLEHSGAVHALTIRKVWGTRLPPKKTTTHRGGSFTRELVLMPLRFEVTSSGP